MPFGFDGYPTLFFGNAAPWPPDIAGIRFVIAQTYQDDLEIFFDPFMGPTVDQNTGRLIDFAGATIMRLQTPWGYYDIDLFDDDPVLGSIQWYTENGSPPYGACTGMYFFGAYWALPPLDSGKRIRTWSFEDAQLSRQYTIQLLTGTPNPPPPQNETNYSVTIAQAPGPNSDWYGFNQQPGFGMGSISPTAATASLYGASIVGLMYNINTDQWRLVMAGNLWESWIFGVSIEIPSQFWSVGLPSSASATTFTTDGTYSTWTWDGPFNTDQRWGPGDVGLPAIVEFDLV